MLTERQLSAAAPVSPPPPRPFLRRHVWWIVALALVVVSAVLVRVINTRPGYDPYGWLIWGYQTIHLNLDLGGAPSWKPLTLLFTTPFSLAGHLALWLWMTAAAAISFAGSIFAGRIAYRIVLGTENGRAGDRAPRETAPAPRRARNAAIAAAIFAGAGMYGIQDTIVAGIGVARNSYLHYIFSYQSDPMIVTMVLAAIDFHMIRRRSWVIAMLTLAGLGRPEVWPFLFLYSIWCWREFPEMRKVVAISWFLTAFLWFGIPTITNGRPLVAGDLANLSPRALRQNKIIGTIDRFKTLNLWPVWVFTLGAILWALHRLRQGGFRLHPGRLVPWLRGREHGPIAEGGPEDPRELTAHLLILALTAGIVIWLIVEVAFALHGWPAVPRYVFEPAVVAILLGAIGFGWLLREIPIRLALPRWAGIPVAVILSLALVPGALSRIRHEHKDLFHEHARTTQINHLAGFISRLGGKQAVLACGRPVVNVEYVSIMGWLTGLNDGKVGHRPNFELHQRYPIVFFTPLPNGWAAYPWHTRTSQAAGCRHMKALYIFTRGHPGGELVVNRTPPKPTPLRPHGHAKG